MTMEIHINPGSGAVPEATEANALANIEQFMDDLLARGHGAVRAQRKADKDYGDGRWCWRIAVVNDPVTTGYEVQMPGLPLDQVRWLKEEGQDIWQFPRLYVADSSWIWFFALEQFDGNEGVKRWPNGTVTGGEPVVFKSAPE